LTALRTALRTDVTLKELAKSPLTLNVMTWAYWNDRELPIINSFEERRKHLFDRYIQRMFDRRKKEDAKDPNQGGTEQPYLKDQTEGWLVFLADQMKQKSKTIFLIEEIQTNWLKSDLAKNIYSILYAFVNGLLLFSLINFTFIIGSVFFQRSLEYESIKLSLWGGLISGLIFTVTTLITNYESVFSNEKTQIQTIESLKWSWKIFWRILPSSILLLFIFLQIAKYCFNREWITFEFWKIMETNLIIGFVPVILTKVMEGPNLNIDKKTFPNQGIQLTAINSALLCVPYVFIGTLVFWGIFMWQKFDLITSLSVAPIGGIFYGLIMWFSSAKAIFQHFFVRVLLRCYGYIPWNYAHFLDHATERIFLQKVGGGYLFIHRLLRDHFANRKQN
jgi:magnesium-transporting ATPase (P-type)